LSSTNLFLEGDHLAAFEFFIIDNLYTPYLLIDIAGYVPGPGLSYLIAILAGSELNFILRDKYKKTYHC